MFNSPLFVGFEELFDRLERVNGIKVPNWPPYNLKKVAEDKYVMEFAVAGFGSTDIDIELKGDELMIRGAIKNSDGEYIHKGIAERAFERSFTLNDHISVKNASVVNGMLRVWLDHIIPDANKPKKIPVGSTEDFKTVSKEALPA